MEKTPGVKVIVYEDALTKIIKYTQDMLDQINKVRAEDDAHRLYEMAGLGIGSLMGAKGIAEAALRSMEVEKCTRTHTVDA